MTNQEQYELICEKAEKYDRLVGMLDKIKADMDCDMREAAYMYDDEHLDELYSYQDGLKHALNIIDKYKAERGEKE